jgi:hypothetical protein
MKCPRCGNPVNPSAAQCPNCAQPLRPTAPQATTTATATLATTSMQQAFEAQRKRNTTIGIIVGVIALLAAIGFGIQSGALGAFGNNPNKKLLSAPASSGGNVLAKNAAQDPNATMPADVLAWLKHLEKCEAKKVEISGNQAAEVTVWMQKNSALGAGMGMMNPYDQSGDGEDKAPGSYTKGKVLDLRKDWQELIDFFHSVQPPDECQPIAMDFDRSLNQIPAEMGDIGDILNSADADPSGAMKGIKKLQNGSYDEIDRYFERCDQS